MIYPLLCRIYTRHDELLHIDIHYVQCSNTVCLSRIIIKIRYINTSFDDPDP